MSAPTIRDMQRENRIAMALLPAIIATAMYLAAGTSARAIDCYLTNTTPILLYFTNAANWNPAVPGPADNANFTNENMRQDISFGDASVITNANAYLNTPSQSWLYLYIQNATYWVTNSLIVGQNAGSFNYLARYDEGGTLAVTNAQGTARMIVGQQGQGQFDLLGALSVDHLYVTNNGAIVNEFFLCNNGNLTVRGDSTIKYLNLGGYGGTYTSRWNVLGGTTTVQNNQNVGERCMMILTASGTNTVINFSNTVFLGVNPSSTARNGNSMIVTNGATVNVGVDTYVGYWAVDPDTPNNNLVEVTGSNSLFNSGSLMIGEFGGSSNQVRVANGGRLNTTPNRYYLTLGAGAGAHDNTLTVTGAGSIVSNGAQQTIWVGRCGYSNQIVISDGGQLIAPAQWDGASAGSLSIGYHYYTSSETGGVKNTVLVTGTNSRLQAAGRVVVGYTANNALVITNTGQAIIGGDLLLGSTISDVYNSTGAMNQVAIGGGGTGVVSGAVKIGAASTTSNNTVLVTGAGSLLTNSGALSIGYSGDTLGGGNQLVLGGGGRVFTTSLDLRDSVLTNTLKFMATPGSTNLGIVNVAGAMTIANAATAKLVVDMSQYTAFRAGVTSVVLVTYGTLPTPFSSGNIEVTPPPMLPFRITATVDQTTDNRIQVNLRVPKGTVFSVR